MLSQPVHFPPRLTDGIARVDAHAEITNPNIRHRERPQERRVNPDGFTEIPAIAGLDRRGFPLLGC